MSERKNIEAYFDMMSANRNLTLEGSPWLRYEQAVRQQAVYDLLEPVRGMSVLDVGAGNLRDSMFLANLGYTVYAIDLSLMMIQEGLTFIEKDSGPRCAQASALSLPFWEEAIDNIVCSEVIEHIPAFEKVFSEFRRCLRPDGVLVITSPNWNSLYGLNRKLIEVGQLLMKRQPWGGHPYDQWKTPAQLESILFENGFRIDRWIGICYLPGFSFGLVLNELLERMLVRIARVIEPMARYRAAKWGYGIGIRALKAS